MKFLFRIILPLICSTYLALLIGQYTNGTLGRSIFSGVLFFWLLNNLFNLFYGKQLVKKSIGKKHLLIGALLSILIMTAGSSYLIPASKGSGTSAFVTVTALGIKDGASSSSEVWITGITNAGKAVELDKIPLDSGWALKEHFIVSYQQQPAVLTIKIDNPSHPVITLMKHDWSGKVKIKSGSSEEMINLYKPGQSEDYQYEIKELTVIPGKGSFFLKPLFIVLSFVFFMIFNCLSIIIITRNSRYYLLYSVLLWAILFAAPGPLLLRIGERVLLLGVSVLAGILFSRAIKSGMLRSLNRSSRVILTLIAFYTAFACVGNAVFMFGNPGIGKIAFFLLAIIWSLSVDVSFLYLTYVLKQRVLKYSLTHKTLRERFSGIKLWAAFFFIFTSVACIYLYSFFPAAMSSDAIDQWSQALGLRPLNNWHPVFHTWTNKLLILLYKSPATVALGQIVFMASAVSGFLVFLYNKGIPKSWLFLFALIFSLLPVNGINVITLWKDIPFTISLLWLTLVFARISTEEYFFKRISGCLELVVALVLVALFRHNGIVVYLLSVAGLLYYFFKRRNPGNLICILSSIILMGAYNLIVLDSPGVIPNSPSVKLVAPIHGIAAIISNQATLPAGVQKDMENILPEKEWSRLFSPYSAMGYLFQTNGVFIKNLSVMPTPKALQMYSTSFIKHPYILTRDRLQGTDYLWNVAQPDNAFNSKYITYIEANDLGLQQKDNKMKDLLKGYLKASEGIAGIFLWRVGIYNIFILLLLFFVRENGSSIKLLPFLPWLGCVVSLIPAMLDQEFRYVYFVFVLFGFLWLFVLSNYERRE